ncbi:hypothetical protein FIBSPDRAFT_880852 [Athelia psychrophila]|uniref:Letm1 RBD domain-containing protein n=1 Tax=Athelia psychrophila TaxID=1759441 RepID=A0A166X023_9AGAM|nr:hypothetical protein FIBSPDRAFT_880852 [Fibularhizoctonia sp. CBS 109695]
MLRSIARNARVERQLAAQRHASLLGQGSASSRIHYAYRDSSACSRLLFTRLQHTKVETSGSHANPPPPSPNVPRKAKVDIKPAPVKPTVTPNGATSTSKPSRHMKVDHAKSLPPKGVELPPADTVASVSVSGGLSEAKKDIDKAQEHGVMAPPPPGASWIKRMIHHARELFKFYWNGLKQINRNRLLVAEIKKRVQEGGAPISRSEYRFMRTYKEDALKLIPFLLVVITVEELIPLIAIYAPFMLPSTTIFPSQLKRMEDKALAKQLTFTAPQTFLAIVNAAREHQPSQRNIVDLMGLRNLGRSNMRAVAGVLRLATWGPAPMILRRIDNHLKFVAEDDLLLATEDMGGRLSDRELSIALYERGIIATDLKPELARKQLKMWLTSVSFGAEEHHAVSRRIFAVAKANANTTA